MIVNGKGNEKIVFCVAHKAMG